MVKTILRYSLITIAALLVLLALLLSTAPAQLLPLMLQRFAPDVQLSATEGSLWQGTARHAVANVGGRAVGLGELSWILAPGSLLSLNPQVHITIPAYQARADIRASLDQQITITDLQASLPLTVLGHWFPKLLGGQAAIEIDELVLAADNIRSITGTVDLLNIAWLGGDRSMHLGDYHAVLWSEDGMMMVRLTDTEALLGVDGTLSLAATGTYQLEAELTTVEALAPEIQQTLRLLGKKDNGALVIKRNGRF